MTAGLAGADLANIINEAALLAGRANKEEVEPSDFKEAVERQIAGLEKKSRRISPNLEKSISLFPSNLIVSNPVPPSIKISPSASP